MALVGYEALIVAGIIIVVFLWGPHKLPELAKSIGETKREFDKAAKEASTLSSTPGPSNENPEQVALITKSMRITTAGKTRVELAKEIASNVMN